MLCKLADPCSDRRAHGGSSSTRMNTKKRNTRKKHDKEGEMGEREERRAKIVAEQNKAAYNL